MGVVSSYSRTTPTKKTDVSVENFNIQHNRALLIEFSNSETNFFLGRPVGKNSMYKKSDTSQLSVCLFVANKRHQRCADISMAE